MKRLIVICVISFLCVSGCKMLGFNFKVDEVDMEQSSKVNTFETGKIVSESIVLPK